ncbi:MAG: rhomboid family intramembrane serine protease [Isosphaeraceae bacterium]
MGIYDREYYRDETRGSGWLSGATPACKALVLINVGVYLAQVVFSDTGLTKLFAAHSDQILREFHVWQLITATFLHDPASPFHILWNMLILWFVGREVESIYGSREFVGFYLVAGAVSTLCWAVLDLAGTGPNDVPMLGASGAVMAVVVVYTLYNPRRELLLFFVLPVEMWLLLIVYLGCQFFFLMQQFHGAAAAGTAFAAHLGGAAFGYVYKTSGIRITHLVNFKPRRKGPKLRIVPQDIYDRDVDLPSPAPVAKSVTPSAPSRSSPIVALGTEEQFEARVDEVLAKIARQGSRDGLTDEEKSLLQEASRRARDRRSDRVR